MKKTDHHTRDRQFIAWRRSASAQQLAWAYTREALQWRRVVITRALARARGLRG